MPIETWAICRLCNCDKCLMVYLDNFTEESLGVSGQKEGAKASFFTHIDLYEGHLSVAEKS